MADRSISMCVIAGVPSVSTMSSARAASATEEDSSRRPRECTRSSSSSAPCSWNGMRPAPTASRISALRSIPITRLPRSAKQSASGSPTRPRPTIATLRATSAPAGARQWLVLVLVLVLGLVALIGDARAGAPLGVAELLFEQRKPLSQDLRLIGELRHRDREVQEQHEHEEERH